MKTTQKYYEKSLSIKERLARQTDSVAAQRNLYMSYDKLGDFYKKQGNLDSAED
ncbi:MAG: hypothetical protein K2K91_08160 [Ruminococcus sp.]|nr:hypothetical protein [Ruminococcus sp.]